MRARIVLSVLLLCILPLAGAVLIACSESWSADDEQDRAAAPAAPAAITLDAGATGNGIGTSPSLVPDAGSAK